MGGDDIPLADGDAHELDAERAVRQRPQECEKLISDLRPAHAVFVKVVEANGSYAAGSAGSNGGLIQADPGR